MKLLWGSPNKRRTNYHQVINSKARIWIVLFKAVYDLAEFQKMHPGG